MTISNKNNGENGSEVSVADILHSSIGGLAESNPTTYEHIIRLAEAKYFEQHQTQGSLKAIADELIARSLSRGDKVENQ